MWFTENKKDKLSNIIDEMVYELRDSNYEEVVLEKYIKMHQVF